MTRLTSITEINPETGIEIIGVGASVREAVEDARGITGQDLRSVREILAAAGAVEIGEGAYIRPGTDVHAILRAAEADGVSVVSDSMWFGHASQPWGEGEGTYYVAAVYGSLVEWRDRYPEGRLDADMIAAWAEKFPDFPWALPVSGDLADTMDMLADPATFATARAALGLSAEGMAKALHIAEGRTVRRWEAGDSQIPGPVRLAVATWLHASCPASLRPARRLQSGVKLAVVVEPASSSAGDHDAAEAFADRLAGIHGLGIARNSSPAGLRTMLKTVCDRQVVVIEGPAQPLVWTAIAAGLHVLTLRIDAVATSELAEVQVKAAEERIRAELQRVDAVEHLIAMGDDGEDLRSSLIVQKLLRIASVAGEG